jgi:hypothetical protein
MIFIISGVPVTHLGKNFIPKSFDLPQTDPTKACGELLATNHN